MKLLLIRWLSRFNVVSNLKKSLFGVIKALCESAHNPLEKDVRTNAKEILQRLLTFENLFLIYNMNDFLGIKLITKMIL